MSILIRPCGVKDINELIFCGAKFYDLGKFNEKGLNFNPESLGNYIFNLIRNPYGVSLIAIENNRITGSAGGIISPWMADESQLILSELWWWVDKDASPETGKNLLEAFESTGEARGVSFCSMGTHDHDREKALRRVYKNRGYIYLEQHFIKRV